MVIFSPTFSDNRFENEFTLNKTYVGNFLDVIISKFLQLPLLPPPLENILIKSYAVPLSNLKNWRSS